MDVWESNSLQWVQVDTNDMSESHWWKQNVVQYNQWKSNTCPKFTYKQKHWKQNGLQISLHHPYPFPLLIEPKLSTHSPKTRTHPLWPEIRVFSSLGFTLPPNPSDKKNQNQNRNFLPIPLNSNHQSQEEEGKTNNQLAKRRKRKETLTFSPWQGKRSRRSTRRRRSRRRLMPPPPTAAAGRQVWRTGRLWRRAGTRSMSARTARRRRRIWSRCRSTTTRGTPRSPSRSRNSSTATPATLLSPPSQNPAFAEASRSEKYETPFRANYAFFWFLFFFFFKVGVFWGLLSDLV